MAKQAVQGFGAPRETSLPTEGLRPYVAGAKEEMPVTKHYFQHRAHTIDKSAASHARAQYSYVRSANPISTLDTWGCLYEQVSLRRTARLSISARRARSDENVTITYDFGYSRIRPVSFITSSEITCVHLELPRLDRPLIIYVDV